MVHRKTVRTHGVVLLSILTVLGVSIGGVAWSALIGQSEESATTHRVLEKPSKRALMEGAIEGENRDIQRYRDDEEGEEGEFHRGPGESRGGTEGRGRFEQRGPGGGPGERRGPYEGRGKYEDEGPRGSYEGRGRYEPHEEFEGGFEDEFEGGFDGEYGDEEGYGDFEGHGEYEGEYGEYEDYEGYNEFEGEFEGGFEGGFGRGRGPGGPAKGGPGGPGGFEFDEGKMMERVRSEMERHAGRACKDLRRESEQIGRHASKDTVAEVEALAEECDGIIADALSRIEGGEEPWVIGDEMRFSIEGLMDQFRDIMESQWQDRACEDVKWGLKGAERGVMEEAPEMIERTAERDLDLAEEMEELRQKAEGLLEEGEGALEAGDCDGAMDILDELQFGIQDEFFSLMEEGGPSGRGGFGPPAFGGDFEERYDDLYDEFEFDDVDAKDFKKHLKDNKYGAKHFNLMRQMAGGVLEDYLAESGKVKGGSDLIDYAAETGVETGALQDLLEVKADLLKQIQELKDQVAGLKSELQEIVAQVKAYNFGEKTALKAQAFIEEELPTLSTEEAEERLEGLKKEARREKHKTGVIPFRDTDDDQWYTKFAAQAKAEGLVKGTGESKGNELAPERPTNLAEAVTLFARVSGGVDENAVPLSDVGQRLPEWAQAAAGTLEEQGVNLDAIFGKGAQPDEEVSRGEIARLLTDVLELPETNIEKAKVFTDIGAASSAEVEAIAAVKAAGIMTGNPDGTFAPDDPLNRAALVKVLSVAGEKTEE